MIRHIRDGEIRADETVVFLHTGGMPALFTEFFRRGVRRNRPTARVAGGKRIDRRSRRGLEAVERGVAGKDRRLRPAPVLHQRDDVIGRCPEPGAQRRIKVGPQFLAHRPSARLCPGRAVQRRIDLPDVDDARRDDGAIVTAFVAAASPFALAAIEIRGVLAARHKDTRAGRGGADDAGLRAAARVAHRTFVRGRVPGFGNPRERWRIEAGRGDDRRDVLGVEIVADAAAVVGPQMKEVQLDERRDRRLRPRREMPGRRASRPWHARAGSSDDRDERCRQRRRIHPGRAAASARIFRGGFVRA